MNNEGEYAEYGLAPTVPDKQYRLNIILCKY